jgi:serine/threonine protein phosphatase PrpC
MILTVEAAARSHVGLVRQRNEDSVYAGQSLFAVADGLGGHVAGDVASAIVIQTLRPYDQQVEAADLPAAMGRAVHAANGALRREIEANPELAGMASTLVAMMWSGTVALIANVGDSRAYLLRGPGTHPDAPSELVQITEDHTYEHLVADAASVPALPERLSRFLDGRLDGRSPDLATRNVHAGDRYLLCSDGLSSVVPQHLIHDAMTSSDNPGETADLLITLAIDHGGPDNITVVVIDMRTGDGG